MARARTTLVLERRRLSELKQLAAKEQRTLSSVVDEFLREGLDRRRSNPTKVARLSLPSFDMGKPLVDLSDREQLLDAMSD